MNAEVITVAWIGGAVVGLVALYFIIRLAVSHGIRDVRRRDAEDADRAAMRAAGIRAADLD